jgi:hypothetical protein
VTCEPSGERTYTNPRVREHVPREGKLSGEDGCDHTVAIPSEQLRAIADCIGDPSPPTIPATATAVEEYLDLASTAGHHIVWNDEGWLVEIVR